MSYITDGWADHETSAFERGMSNGWDSANYAEAYGGRQEESFEAEGHRRGMALFLRADERKAWLLGWLLGGVRFGQGEYADGSKVGAEIEDMTTGQPGLSKL